MGNCKLIHIGGVMVCKHDIHINENQKDMELFLNIKQTLRARKKKKDNNNEIRSENENCKKAAGKYKKAQKYLSVNINRVRLNSVIK